MTNFTDPSNVANLIGLWDFKAGATTADTGLDDGIAQNGSTIGGNGIAPRFANDQLIVGAGTNAHPTVFDVNSDANSSADDAQFNLDRGTIEVQFTQSAQSGTSEDVIVSRGEQQIDRADEGFFEIRVTADGRVQAYHNTDNGDHVATLSTAAGFFSPGQVINVKYSFDVDFGARLTVLNVTTGASDSIVTDVQGLTFDLTDNDDEEFTFGAREAEDGRYDKEFQGAIDYVALYTTTNNAVSNPIGGPDFIVEGTSGADLIDAAYTGDPEGDRIDALDNGLTPPNNDDVVEAGAGNDTVQAGAGDDTVFGGTGNDFILGDDNNIQAGDDLLLGEDGNDTLCGLAGDDTLVGGAGDDLLEGMVGNDLLLAGTGADRAFGDEGDDTIFGNDGNDTIDGGTGSDLAYGGDGGDSILGGSGNDTLFGDNPAAGTVVSGNLIFNGSFEITSGLTTTGFGFRGEAGDGVPGWTDALGQEIDIHNDGRGGLAPTDGANWLDLEASPGNNRVGQTVAGVEAGETYRLTFDAGDKNNEPQSGPGENLIQVYWGGQLVATIDPEPGVMTEYTFNLIGGAGDGSNRLEFRGTGDLDNFGASVDDVRLVQTAGEPDTGGSDVIDGGTGDDLIDGQQGNDTLRGGDGNDTITAGAGDSVTGGSGNDSIFVNADELDATGDNDAAIFVDGSTAGTDRDTLDLTDFVQYRNLVQTNDADGDSTSGTLEVQNADGDWVPVTFAEIETLILPPLAPADPDGIVDGEDTGETMGLGYDDANAPTDGGGDMITDGADSIEANGGNDTVDGAGGNDTIDGGTGNDVITGGAGNDSVLGGAGSDTIRGATGNDALAGGTGDDDIFVGGSDMATGGSGDDVFAIDTTDTATNVNATIDGGTDATSGNPDDTGNGDAGDVLDLGDRTQNLTVALQPNPETGTVNGLDGDAATDISFQEIERIVTGTGNDTITGGTATGGVNLDTGAGNDSVTTGSGNDTVVSGTGNDTVTAGAGADSVTAGSGNDSVDGGTGNDTIDGGAGSDTLIGGEGTDSLIGGLGDDDIVVGAGDTALGGGGDDDFTVNPLLTGTGTITIIGGETDEEAVLDPTNNPGGRIGDTLDLRGLELTSLVYNPADPTFNPATGIGESGTAVYLNAAGDPVTINFSQIENVLNDPLPDGVVDGEETGELMNPGYDDGGQATDGGGDIIDGADGDNDSIRGNGGNDTINAGAGDDTVDGGTGDDTVNGGTGNDIVMGGTGDDLVTGGIGNDTVMGNEGDDTLRGNEGNDLLQGGDGDDSMGGAEGRDTIEGGAGDDMLDGGSGDDVLDGGLGDDTIDGSTGRDIITDLDGDNLINSDNPGSFNPDLGVPIPLPGGGFAVTPGDNPDDNRDTITTGAGNDTINAGDDADLIDAGDGDNVVDGGTDRDTITTGSGDDSITGGEGDDLITSGDGDDTINGGVGDPAANFIDAPNPGFAPDPILNNGDDTIFAGAGDDLVNGEDDNDLIDGGTGDDTLDGGIDDDTVLGGAGDDVIIGGQGADSLDGGLGDDTFNVGTFTDPNGTGDYAEGLGDIIIGGEDPGDGDEDILDLNGSKDFRILFEDSIDPTGTPGESGRVVFYTDNTKSVIKGELVFKEIEKVIPCFTPGAMIATPRGEVPVETLRAGDRVITRDNGIQEIRWTGSRTLNRQDLAMAPNLKPILIKKGSLGRGLPGRDMVVSPQHRILIAGEIPQLYFEESEVLVPAKHLLGRWGISKVETLRTTYIHFMFDQHEVVLCNGAWTESFQPGRETLTAMGEATREEILALFPELATVDGLSDYAAARRSLKAHEAKLLQL